ncbi:hypothetical protein IJM86_06140 [bacterium]|nr:hypothetical protein [bacterium]
MHKYPQVDNMTPKAKYQFEKKNIIDLHNEVYSTLQLFKKITENTKTDLIVLLDRTDISNYFWLKKQNTKLSFQDFKNLLKNDLIIPDCTFYLNVPQDILINRITHDTYPNSSRNKERKCTIKQYHTLYDNTIKDSEER